MRTGGRRDEEEEITDVGRVKLREGKGSGGRKRREGTGGGAGTQGTGIGQGVGNKGLGRSLSMTLTAPGNLSLRSWHVIKEVCASLLAAALQSGVFPPDKACPALGAQPHFLSLPDPVRLWRDTGPALFL